MSGEHALRGQLPARVKTVAGLRGARVLNANLHGLAPAPGARTGPGTRGIPRTMRSAIGSKILIRDPDQLLGTKRPRRCSKEVRPVCGSDNKLYRNPCLARAAGVGYQPGGCGSGVCAKGGGVCIDNRRYACATVPRLRLCPGTRYIVCCSSSYRPR